MESAPYVYTFIFIIIIIKVLLRSMKQLVSLLRPTYTAQRYTPSLGISITNGKTIAISSRGLPSIRGKEAHQDLTWGIPTQVLPRQLLLAKESNQCKTLKGYSPIMLQNSYGKTIMNRILWENGEMPGSRDARHLEKLNPEYPRHDPQGSWHNQQWSQKNESVNDTWICTTTHSRIQRCKKNYAMLNMVLHDWVPWHWVNYDFSTIDINQYFISMITIKH